MTVAAEASVPVLESRVRGLDSLRFILAAWVMIGHLGALPYVNGIDGSTPLGFVARGVLRNLVSGPAAVIVFFVISGFCIHFPYRHAKSVELFPFFARRHVRILVPVGVALVLARFLSVRLPVFNESILWSLLCEEIYYTIFPLLLKARTRWGWPRLIGAAFVAAFAVVLTNPGAGDYPSYGPGLNWLLGLPCWLLGCYLAERWDGDSKSRPPSTSAMWMWRLVVLGTSVACSALRFHTALTYPWTLNLFALLVALWLRNECIYSLHHRPLRLLEVAGLFSYSIYLVHLLGRELYFMAGVGLALPPVPAWLWMQIFVLASCFVFYKAVEQPSHKLARRLYHLLMERRKGKVLSARETCEG